MPYLGKYTKLSATVGTTNVNVTHGLGTTPSVIWILPTGSVAGVVRQVSRDGTNITLVSTLASTVVEVVAFE